MNYKLICMEVFAILASYLVFSLTVASAANVKIYYNGVYQSSVQYNPQSLVSKSASVNGGLNVEINITNATNSNSVEKVYIYKCRGLAPAECISTAAPDVMAGLFSAAYPWASVADKTSGYPQKANFAILVKVRASEKTFWTGFWQRLERTDSLTFTPYENQISEIEVHAKDIDDVANIRNFITNSRMIPFNPQWVTKVIFSVASSLYVIKSTLEGIEKQQFVANEVPQKQLTSMDKDYGLVFANTGGDSNIIYSPVTLNLNPNYNCGNNNCESGLGETQANCCLDCPCQAGYYCDIAGGCKQSSEISLSLYGTPVTSVSNCNQQHTLNIAVRINNPPTGLSITSMRYRLGSNPYRTMTCSSSPGYIFTCPVIVPAVPDCNAGTYRVGPNYINFSISYPDGRNTASKPVPASFPDVVIGSYTCGNNDCENSLGENQVNCCYDCGCSSGYCDITDSTAGSCRPDPSNSDLRASGLTPSQFYTHRSGDSVRFLAQVTNMPVTLSITGSSCSLGCSRSDSQACSATCSISCSKVGSSDQSIYNSSCSMTFTITSYDSLKSYSLFPTLNFSIRYTNGSHNTLQKVLSNSFATISIGAHWCGDRKCDPDETSATCCYDCPCQQGQYCDTQNIDYRSESDSCKSNPQIEIENIGPTAFTSTYEQHIINVTGHANKASGIGVTPSCVFNSSTSGVPCYATCEEKGSDSQTYRFLCQITVPSIYDYNTSRFFNPATRKLVLSPNRINITLSYNNGSSKTMNVSSFAIPEIVISVVPRCGDGSGNEGVCERNVGENGTNCCLDCGCKQDYGSGYFCYMGRNPNGECLSNSAINMRILKITPDPVNCTISEKGKVCQPDQTTVFFSVLNPPSDLKIVDNVAYYRILSEGKYTDFTATNCYPVSNQAGNYSCPFLTEPTNKITPGTEEKTLELNMTLSYNLSGNIPTFNYPSDSFKYTIKRVYTEAVASCIEHQNSVDKKLGDLEGDKRLYTMLAIVFFIMTVLFWAAYFSSCWKNLGACEEWWKWWAIVSGLIGGCGLAYVLNKLQGIDQQMKQLEAQKQSMCASTSFSGLSSSISPTGDMLYMAGQLYGGITCMYAGMSGLQASGVVGGSNPPAIQAKPTPTIEPSGLNEIKGGLPAKLPT